MECIWQWLVQIPNVFLQVSLGIGLVPPETNTKATLDSSLLLLTNVVGVTPSFTLLSSNHFPVSSSHLPLMLHMSISAYMQTFWISDFTTKGLLWYFQAKLGVYLRESLERATRTIKLSANLMQKHINNFHLYHCH